MLPSLIGIYFKAVFDLQWWRLRFGDNFYFYKILPGFNQYYVVKQQLFMGWENG